MSATVGCSDVGAFKIAEMRSKTQSKKISQSNMETEVVNFTFFFSRLDGGNLIMFLNPISELVY